MRLRFHFIAAPLVLALAACAMTRPPAASVTFVIVRHAEKANDDPRDPTLSETGRARAEALAGQFRKSPLAAAYATPFRRTQQTAQPAATAAGITVTNYDAALPAGEFAAQLRALHAQGTVLVVGHSNTVPDIVAALCTCEVAPLGDGDYGNLYRVDIDDDGRARLDQRTY